MGESLGTIERDAIKMQGNRLPHGAIHCTSIHVRVARAIWPRKTAENWAAAAGKKPRIAKYWIASGEVSEAGKLAIIRELD